MVTDRIPAAIGAGKSQKSHQATILDQFTRQAELFANADELHGDAVLSLLVDAVDPQPNETALDVACGPGTVVAAFSRRLHRCIGLDATEAMLEEARALSDQQKLTNVEWQLGDAYRLPFPEASFDIVTSRFAFHHLQNPGDALGEMIRVCKPGGRILLCDGLASDDPEKAAAFNRMEAHRDPSTVAFRPLQTLLDLFAHAGLQEPKTSFFKVPAERDALVDHSFPEGDDRILLQKMIEESVDGDSMGLSTYRDGDTVRFTYPSVILVSEAPG